jgi:phosphoribosylanthranilate isomerase
MKIKVCGMRDAENIQAVAALPIDYMGFIFYEKSPRYVTHPNAGRVQNPASVKKVGVFVNEKIEIIVQKVIEYQLEAVQLHGNETNDFIKTLKIGILKKFQQSTEVLPSHACSLMAHCAQGKDLGWAIIKSISIFEKNDFEKINDYPDADFLLLDTKTPQHGGSGQKFDWTLLDGIDFPKPFFLSGGIALEDVEAIKALKINNLYGLDLNSKFEIEPALKDVGKLEKFIRAVVY